MIKKITFILLLSLVLVLSGCGGETSATENTAVRETMPPSVETVPETTAEASVPKAQEGELSLNISSMTFSLVGESLDVYCGSVPREEITWSTVDEAVATVDNGIVTAAGVGETTVFAEYGDQRVECAISCLAESPESLEALPVDILQKPKKLPPVSDGQPCSFFDDAVIIGDSISYTLMLRANMTRELGNAMYLVRGSNSINGYVMGFRTIGFQGGEYSLEDAIALCGAKKAFIMLGVNDLGYLSVDETFEKLGILIGRIQEKAPEVEIYLESCLPVWETGTQGARNADVDAYNQRMLQFTEENGCHYVEVASYIKDHTNGMAQMYCSDFQVHMNYEGTDAWIQALKLYGRSQEVSAEPSEPPAEAEETRTQGAVPRLNAASMTFSLVGDTMDIYCGSVPREKITWGTADKAVATVENGIVTAAGVGETTVFAEYGDQRVECVIGCLAESPESLAVLPADILQKPKKLPPASDGQPCSFFDDAVIIGDSVSTSLMHLAAKTGELGQAVFLVRGGSSIYEYVKRVENVYFQGIQQTVEDAVAKVGAKKAFIMMGVNDLAWLTPEETMEYLEMLISDIRRKNPDTEIYLESCLPVWEKGDQVAKNGDVEAFNELMIRFAEANDCHYVEVASYIKDHTDGMAKSYCSDFTTHMNEEGTDAWMQALKLYALTQTLEEK